MGELNNIPKRWKAKKLREVCRELQSGKRPKGGVQGIEFGIPSLGAEHLNFNGGFKFQKIKFVSKEFAEQMKKGIVCKDDIIVVKDGATTGKTSFVGADFPFDFSVINEHVFIVRLNNEVLPKFAFYKLFSSTGHKEILEDFRGAAQGGISSGFLDKVNIPFPSIPEQQAIVSKIEELLSDLENGKQQLQIAQQQLKIYRQSLLKWAFEGKLTNKNVKDGELPKGWKVVELKDVSAKITDGEHFRPITQETGIPFLSAKDVRDLGVSFDDPLYISGETAKKAMQRCNPERGDLLIVSRGATVGRMCIVNTDRQFCLLGSVILIKVNQTINSKFLNFVLKSPIANQKMITVSGATAQQAIYLRDIKNITIPLPTVEEQQLIVDELESKLTVCDKIEETISQSLLQAESLRQSILKKAFSGELVKNHVNP